MSTMEQGKGDYFTWAKQLIALLVGGTAFCHLYIAARGMDKKWAFVSFLTQR